ncbi:hypothetical protein [Reichenbachiella versicolor]|uniref:hypothetical protein n=1 Tax=Reichenbachiella versicolor TaxID=1821036 RepID=UPI000D6DF1AE|nr:hypothetical protein [Reichenbachiella versicolor]
MIEALFFVKLLIAISFVVGLSLLAENVSTKVAGILSAYPTGSAISLFFFGLEVSPEFAADSAIYNMLGLSAALFFVLAYYLASTYFNKFSILWSSISGILVYLVVVWSIHYIEVNRYIAFLIPSTIAVLFAFAFRNIKNIDIQSRAKLSYRTLLLRGSFAALIIVVITSLPNYVGASWSGLFSAFPTTLFPFMLIIHFTYTKDHVHTIIKNVPIGVFSLIIYSLVVSLIYPVLGIYWGTLVSFIAATLYLLLFREVKKRMVLSQV